MRLCQYSGLVRLKLQSLKKLLNRTNTDNKRDARLVDACIKTVAAFLNSDGGELLVGVADNGQIIGLERDQN